MEKYPIKTTGHLCDGNLISIGWPEPFEYDWITALRNDKFTRKWFLDNKLLNINKNRTWISSVMPRPQDALLCIRLKKDKSFLGTIGWTNWDLKTGTACFGRLCVDRNALKEAVNCFPADYMGVAVDAALALRDFAMEKMELNQIETFILSNNDQAKLVNIAVGLREINRSIRKQGSETVEVIEMCLTKTRWSSLRIK